MGRPPKGLGEGSDTVGFKIKKIETVDVLKTIAKREGVELKEIYNRAFDEYALKHGPGNFQTLLGSYEEGGVKSDGQIETEIFNQFRSRKIDLTFKELIARVREMGFKKDAVAISDSIAKKLDKEGIRVWR
jgi:hypothetical protein